MAHNYHPHCGCYSCGRQEDAAERDDELRGMYLTALTGFPDFINEVPLNAEECAAAAEAIKGADMAELGRVFLAAVEREAAQRIEARADQSGITPGEAAERLYGIYRPEPVRAAA